MKEGEGLVPSNARYSAQGLTVLVAVPVFIMSMLLVGSALAAHSAVAQCGKKPHGDDHAMLQKWLDCERNVDLAELSRLAGCKPPIASSIEADVLRCLGKPDSVDPVKGRPGTKAWGYWELGAFIYIKGGTVTSVNWLGGRS